MTTHDLVNIAMFASGAGLTIYSAWLLWKIAHDVDERDPDE